MSPDDIEGALEAWACWRLRRLELTYGDSVLARLRDPFSGQPPCSRPIMHGAISHWASVLDSALSCRLTRRAVQALVIAYTVPDGWRQASRLTGYGERHLRKLRSKASDIVLVTAVRFDGYRHSRAA